MEGFYVNSECSAEANELMNKVVKWQGDDWSTLELGLRKDNTMHYS